MSNVEILEMTVGLLEEADEVVKGNMVLVDAVVQGRDYGDLAEHEAVQILPLLMSNRALKKLSVSVRVLTEHLMELYDLAEGATGGNNDS